MNAELISTGTELLLGQILNTNAQYLSQVLRDMGIDCYFQTTVGDNRQRMKQTLETALGRADIVIMTGGLGPTQGDITREVLAECTGAKLVLHEPSKKKIEQFFSKRGLPMPDTNLRQAMFPEGSIVVPNDAGTAPGIITERNGKIIINLPGPPRETQNMVKKEIIPYLQNKIGNGQYLIVRVLRTFGITESALEQEIFDLITSQSNPTLALRATMGEIHIRIAASGMSEQQAHHLIDNMESTVMQRVGQYVFGYDDDSLTEVVTKQLRDRKLTISTAESCTGGYIAKRLTDIPGSSEYFLEGVVCYSNDAKIRLIGVSPQTLDQYGAVSEQTAIEMVKGMRALSGSDIAIAVTGIAGPDGASEQKPLGLVYIAIAMGEEVECGEYHFPGKRSNVRLRTTLTALDRVRRMIKCKCCC